MLPDSEVYRACRDCGYDFRRRAFDPVVTVLHFIAQAVQREESFAATWQTMWTPLACDFAELAAKRPALSALTHARSRLPVEVMQDLAEGVCRDAADHPCNTWKGFRLSALDSTSVSMPDDDTLFEHFGRHRTRHGPVRYPLARFTSLLAVGTSMILDYRFGPFTVSETSMAKELVGSVGPGDLVLADRGFAGTPMFAALLARGADFLMRKNARLIVGNLVVVDRLGRDDFIVELPMNKPALKRDPSLPRSVRVRVFKATWKTPSGEEQTEWFVASLFDAARHRKHTLAVLYHDRWQIDVSHSQCTRKLQPAFLSSA